MSVKIIELDYLQDTATYFNAVSDMPNPAWLDSSVKVDLGGRFDIITAAPTKIIETYGSQTLIHSDDHGSTVVSDWNAFDTVRHQLELHKSDNEALPEGIPFAGGALGFWGYGLSPKAKQSATGMPDMRVGIYSWAIVVDRASKKTRLCFQSSCTESFVGEIRKRLCVAHSKSSRQANTFSIGSFTAQIDVEQYNQSIGSIKDYIASGDCYQVNFAQEFTASCSGDSLAAYLKLRQEIPAHYSAYLGFNDGAILSVSPECFLTLSATGEVTTKPIKGTAPRQFDTESDALSADKLLKSDKDRSENVMIVDLMRNDLGRQCKNGSVSVKALCKLESYSNVHHLVSQITGTLSSSSDALTLLDSAFPAGSITGAPKLRSMEIINELEAQPRSVYCGSIGYIGFDGRMDLNVAIRTLEVSGNKVYCRGGGGIVIDSESKSEYQESLDKVGSIMSCLESNFGDSTALLGSQNKTA